MTVRRSGSERRKRLRDTTVLRWVAESAAKHVATLVVAAVASVLATTFWWVMPERVSVTMNGTPKQCSLGAEVEIDGLIKPRLKALSSGLITVRTTPHFKVATKATYDFVGIAEPTKISAIGKFRLKAVREGDAVVTIVVETEDLKHTSFDHAIQVVSVQGTPTLANFTGLWWIILDGRTGQMRLRQNDERQLSGEYQLSDGQRGRVEALHDGHSFYALELMSAEGISVFVESAAVKQVADCLQTARVEGVKSQVGASKSVVFFTARACGK